ncbi:MAG: hypothetical protein AMXMBFR64_22120 [Myxococcales bacterium]
MVVVLALAACELPAPDQAGSPQCFEDADCPSGLRCAKDLGFCYDPTAITKALAVQLIPPAGKSLVTDQRASVVLWGDNTFSAAMTPALAVKGLLHDASNKLPHSIAAQVSATTPGDVPGTTLRSDATSGPGLLEGGHGFTLPVIPDRQYLISVIPDDTRRPPLHVSRKFSTADAALDLALPGLHEYPVVCGLLTDGKDRDKDGMPDPLAGVRVQAIEVRPEGSEGGPLRSSSVAVTGTDVGEAADRRCATNEVELRFPLEAAEYVLQVEPAAPDPARPELVPALIPKLTVDPALWTIQIAGVAGEMATNLQTILVAPPEPVSATLTVRGKSPGGATVPIGGATVMLKGLVEQGGVFTMHGETGTDGVWTGKVLPGAYTVTATPPPDAQHAEVTEELAIDAAGATSTLLAQARARVSGRVTGYDGRVLSECTLRAIRLGKSGAEPVTAVTDTDGRYELWLDPGPWGVVAIPTGTTGYPRLVDRDATPLGAGAKVTRDFVLPAPRLVRGSITSSAGLPLAGVTVEFYDLQAEKGAEQDAPGLDQLRLLGYGVTDDKGSYQALLSPVFKE